MELVEIVNLEVAEKLNNLTFSQFRQLYDSSTRLTDETIDYKGELTKLKKYTKSIIDTKNKLNVKYGYVKDKDFGRLFSKTPSLQNIFNGFRGLLCDNVTYDLDMDNCHPNILINLCNKHKIDCTNLKKYREVFL
jgi:hypothetical protein